MCVSAAIIVLFVAAISVISVFAAETTNKLIINADQGAEKISRNIYGHFSEHLGHCIYGGYWVGEDSPIPNTRGIRNDVVNALRNINIPNLRWPGGCFADEYHWRDGIGPRANRPKMINTHWGGVTEDNSFGTHEFLDLCAQLGTEPVICGNVGSGSVEEMSKWVEYLNFDGVSPMANERRENGHDKAWGVKYWGVGNENWGCGGNMTAEFYADQFKRYATYCRNYGDNRLMKIAGGASEDDYNWTEVLMQKIGPRGMWGISLHHYTTTWRGPKGSATAFDEEDYFITLDRCLKIPKVIDRHITIMDKYDPEKRVALVVDEWGTWFEVEPGTNPGFLYQQNTIRDALVAGIHLNEFNKRCDRIRMANIAQTINVLQSLILIQDEKMLLTPTYHVFEMYKVHQDATLLPTDLQCMDYTFENKTLPSLNVSASKDASGKIHVSVCNLDPKKSAALECDVRGFKPKKVSGRVLTAPAINSHNTFDKPEVVKPADFKDVKLNGSMLTATLPAKSVVVLELE
ncbi:alpha-N-arabinofuranosidase [candidate division KSB1 bacterium]|nr:alpha-N-arabinofuranosidase [candidate division KSB1 bacterium]